MKAGGLMTEKSACLWRSLFDACLSTASNLRATADRLEDAARDGDAARLAEIALASNTWTVDQIRGVALALLRLELT